MENRTILLIDDDPINLEVLEEYLKLGVNADHNIIKCHNGLEGLEAMSKHAGDIDAVLLDRMMPLMSGVEFMQEYNKQEKFRNIPVIMQTASDQREHMTEGFQLGIYHYLIKPLQPTVLNAIVHSAIELYTKQRKLLSDLNASQNLFRYIDNASFRIRTLEDVNVLSISLASLFPDPNKVVNGISEILVNAIEHGNLGITYDEKTQLNLESRWEEEIKRRLNESENKNKFVNITYYKTPEKLLLSIKDEGKGFNYSKYLSFDPSRGADNHGRGIAFANTLSFDSLEYIGAGNEVICMVKLTH